MLGNHCAREAMNV